MARRVSCREFGAGNEIRTRDPNLGKVVLYQLSYSRAAKQGGYCNGAILTVKQKDAEFESKYQR